jgi:hypothetical protein
MNHYEPVTSLHHFISFAEGVEVGRCLVVVGDEVMFGWGPVLTATNRFRMGIMRGRRGTLRGDHAVGAGVWTSSWASGT